MRTRGRRVVLAFVTVALFSVAITAVANAAPAWKFNGTELTGKETAVGAAISSSLTIPGATTTCAHFLYNMKISNTGGIGQGEITELPLFECTTNNNNCKVKSIEAEKLPWPLHLTTVGGKDYIVVEKIAVGIVYEGTLCSLSGSRVRVSGTAGGLIENVTETATFNKASFEATKTELKVGSGPVEWTGVFPTEAFETHREQHLEG